MRKDGSDAVLLEEAVPVAVFRGGRGLGASNRRGAEGGPTAADEPQVG